MTKYCRSNKENEFPNGNVMEVFTLTWSIKNPSTLRNSLRSSKISTETGYCFYAELKIKPVINLCLTLVEGKSPVKVQHNVCLHARKRKCKVKNYDFLYSLESLATRTSLVNLKNNFDGPVSATDFENSFWRNDVLTINCIMTLSKHGVQSEKESRSIESVLDSDDVETLGKDLETLFKTRQNSDLVIKIGKDTIKAHKLVLCARSTVFARTFQGGIQESTPNTIEITDIPLSAFNEFIAYVYTDKISNKTFENCCTLYCIADRYAVLRLKAKCVKIMIPLLTTSNVCCALILADSYSDEMLKRSAMIFLRINMLEVQVSTQWKAMLREHPSLFDDYLAFFGLRFDER